MPLPGRIFAGDEELGKKDDDHRPSHGTTVPSMWSWMTWTSIPRIRRRRLAVGIVILLALYLFFRSIAKDISPIVDRISTGGSAHFSGIPVAPAGKPPRTEEEAEAQKHYYNGPVRFYYLATSLHAIARTMGYREVNKNVLFAAANLRSASRLIPMACEMARWNRNVVHFAFLGRDDMAINDMQMVNGVGNECNIFWHDARPDYSSWSSDARMEESVDTVLGHIHGLMHPQVYIIDESKMEEPFFVRGVRSKSYDTGRTVIELPTNAAEKLMWMTRLDSGSLGAWHNTYVDILIQAPVDSSGSLIRLLKSIEAAEYFGVRRPHLTIELPADIDPPTWSFLENLVWPPLDPSGAPHTSQVTLRHRISPQRTTSEEASIRFVESFYPARPQNSHVLVLSPQVELSPMYYHYLLYNVLEYKHAAYGTNSFEATSLIGISLDPPSHYPNSNKPFIPPRPSAAVTTSSAFGPQTSPTEPSPSPFLYQSPTSDATLYFGIFWLELQSYLTNLFNIPTPPRPLTTPLNPSYLTHIQTLMLTRGYNILYPFTSSLATVHNDLRPPIEDYAPSLSSSAQPNDLQQPLRKEYPLLTTSLLPFLPDEGDLPELATLQLLSHTGTVTSSRSANHAAFSFAEKFKREIGQCAEGAVNGHGMNKYRRLGQADDLFCQDEEDDRELVEKAREDEERRQKNENGGKVDEEGGAVAHASTEAPDQETSRVKTLSADDATAVLAGKDIHNHDV